MVQYLQPALIPRLLVEVMMVENLHQLHHHLMVFPFLLAPFLYVLLIVDFETKPLKYKSFFLKFI
jgi:hypothetical protein